MTSLLLLLFLLDHVDFVGIFKGLKNIGAEHLGTDIVELQLRLVQVAMQADVKNLLNSAEL